MLPKVEQIKDAALLAVTIGVAGSDPVIALLAGDARGTVTSWLKPQVARSLAQNLYDLAQQIEPIKGMFGDSISGADKTWGVRKESFSGIISPEELRKAWAAYPQPDASQIDGDLTPENARAEWAKVRTAADGTKFEAVLGDLVGMGAPVRVINELRGYRTQRLADQPYEVRPGRIVWKLKRVRRRRRARAK